MRLPFTLPALLLATLAVGPGTAAAQDAPRWRFGLTIAAPARILDVNSNEVPDSNSSQVSLGLGFGIEATRLWWVSPKGAVGVFGRASLASANAEAGGEEWSPGKVILAEAGARLRRQITSSIGLFAGAGLSHWAGPDDGAPFSAMGSILVTGEGGFTIRVAPSFNVDVLANGTRIGGDDSKALSSGFVWRLMLGVHREK